MESSADGPTVGWTMIPPWVYDDESLTLEARVLAGRVHGLSDKHGFCWASNSFFAAELGCSRRSIQRYLDELLKAGYITREITKEDGNASQRKLEPSDEWRHRRHGGMTPVSWGGDADVARSRELGLELEEGVQAELLDDGSPSPTSIAITKLLKANRVGWDLKSQTVRSWAFALENDPRYAGLDLPALVLECSEWWEGTKKTMRAPSRAIRRWLTVALKLRKDDVPAKGNGQRRQFYA